MAKIKIDKGVPMPPVTRNRPLTDHPLDRMKVGDSFFLPTRTPGALHYAAKRRGIKLSARREGEGVRVWRVS